MAISRRADEKSSEETLLIDKPVGEILQTLLTSQPSAALNPFDFLHVRYPDNAPIRHASRRASISRVLHEAPKLYPLAITQALICTHLLEKNISHAKMAAKLKTITDPQRPECVIYDIPLMAAVILLFKKLGILKLDFLNLEHLPSLDALPSLFIDAINRNQVKVKTFKELLLPYASNENPQIEKALNYVMTKVKLLLHDESYYPHQELELLRNILFTLLSKKNEMYRTLWVLEEKIKKTLVKIEQFLMTGNLTSVMQITQEFFIMHANTIAELHKISVAVREYHAEHEYYAVLKGLIAILEAARKSLKAEPDSIALFEEINKKFAYIESLFFLSEGEECFTTGYMLNQARKYSRAEQNKSLVGDDVKTIESRKETSKEIVWDFQTSPFILHLVKQPNQFILAVPAYKKAFLLGMYFFDVNEPKKCFVLMVQALMEIQALGFQHADPIVLAEILKMLCISAANLLKERDLYDEKQTAGAIDIPYTMSRSVLQHFLAKTKAVHVPPALLDRTLDNMENTFVNIIELVRKNRAIIDTLPFRYRRVIAMEITKVAIFTNRLEDLYLAEQLLKPILDGYLGSNNFFETQITGLWAQLSAAILLKKGEEEVKAEEGQEHKFNTIVGNVVEPIRGMLTYASLARDDKRFLKDKNSIFFGIAQMAIRLFECCVEKEKQVAIYLSINTVKECLDELARKEKSISGKEQSNEEQKTCMELRANLLRALDSLCLTQQNYLLAIFFIPISVSEASIHNQFFGVYLIKQLEKLCASSPVHGFPPEKFVAYTDYSKARKSADIIAAGAADFFLSIEGREAKVAQEDKAELVVKWERFDSYNKNTRSPIVACREPRYTNSIFSLLFKDNRVVPPQVYNLPIGYQVDDNFFSDPTIDKFNLTALILKTLRNNSMSKMRNRNTSWVTVICSVTEGRFLECKGLPKVAKFAGVADTKSSPLSNASMFFVPITATSYHNPVSIEQLAASRQPDPQVCDMLTKSTEKACKAFDFLKNIVTTKMNATDDMKLSPHTKLCMEALKQFFRPNFSFEDFLRNPNEYHGYSFLACFANFTINNSFKWDDPQKINQQATDLTHYCHRHWRACFEVSLSQVAELIGGDPAARISPPTRRRRY